MTDSLVLFIDVPDILVLLIDVQDSLVLLSAFKFLPSATMGTLHYQRLPMATIGNIMVTVDKYVGELLVADTAVL